ncbi:MAG: CotH kinase family protein [Verrucomicrobiia bacterium]
MKDTKRGEPHRRRSPWILLVLLWAGLGGAHASERQVVINEIMYNPPGQADSLQFLELFNRGASPVDLSDWSFTKGIKFGFDKGVTLAPQSFLVICKDPAAFSGHYGIPAIGPFTGRLSRKSDKLELADASGRVVDSLTYSDEAPWPSAPDGYSSSLERICPDAHSDLPENWSASTLPDVKRAAGTPGTQNDSFSANLPPVISSLDLAPKCPTPQQRVQITARVADADGVRSVTLFYRKVGTRGQSEEVEVPMVRQSGSEQSGEYSASIGPQAHGQLVRFRIVASDRTDSQRISPSPHEPRPAYSYFTFEPGGQGRIPIAFLVNVKPPTRGPGHYEPPSRRSADPSATRGGGAFFYLPSGGGEPETFDFVSVAGRHGGYKVRFQKDRPLKGMTGINIISEGPMRWILAEPLAYAVYRMAGVPAPLTEHVRLAVDGRLIGFHLLVEQPNEVFLERNGRSPDGNLYKLVWYGQSVIEQHEKKTNQSSGHDDLIQLLSGLRRKTGADQWAFIQENFNVEEVANYFAVNMCIQNWDGFFNNYFAYHSPGENGKWEIFPWDEDKTFGDYDGASPRYDWYTMPLTYGANLGNAAQSRSFGGFPFGGGGNWWRPPGYFSGPLLANPQFRAVFLARLEELCHTVFTEEGVGPIIQAMEQRLGPDVRLRAQAVNQSPQRALSEFAGYMESFRAQVKNRRKFILSELAKSSK